jgi:hypothetical protein
MNLRFLLVLIIVLSFVSIGVTRFITNPPVEFKEPDPPFFYTLSPDDLRNISINTGEKVFSWSLREDLRRWYFDDMENIPADLYRWGGITQLLGGPRTQRVLEQSFSDLPKYGLDVPSAEFAVTLRDGSVVKLILGNLTPDGENNYAVIEGFPQLVLVNSSWGRVLERLVDEPPYPEWYFSLTGDPREVILFDNNEVLRAYGYDRDTDIWTICDIENGQLITDPCTGSVLADGDALMTEIEFFGNPQIGGAVALNLQEDVDYIPYGTVLESPYIAVRIENRNPTTNVIEVRRLTMTIGDLTDNGTNRFAVANETSDVIKIDAKWADRILELFYGDILVDNG